MAAPDPKSFRWLVSAFALSLVPILLLVFALNRYFVAPTRLESLVREIEAQDRAAPPPARAIFVIGDASVRLWSDEIVRDLAPLTIVTRGFAGATMRDYLHYADRIIAPHAPRALVIHVGEEDVLRRVRTEIIVERFRALVRELHARFPELRVYVISIKPSPARAESWSTMTTVNRAFAAECENDARLSFIDTTSAMLRTDGGPDPELFSNGIYLNRSGYERWRDRIRPVLLERESAHEPTPS